MQTIAVDVLADPVRGGKSSYYGHFEDAHEAHDSGDKSGHQQQDHHESDDNHGAFHEHGSDHDSGQGGASGRRGGDSGKFDQGNGPPKTLLELIQRLTAPRSPGQVELASGEILGVDLGPAEVAKAHKLGFTVAKKSAAEPAHGHGRLLLLDPPPGLDIASARELLRSELPADQIGLNYAYRPYRNAAEEKGEGELRPQGVRKASVGGCDAARCYAPAVIGWQPNLRGCTKTTRIGIIDTPIDLAHPTFAGRKVKVATFRPEGAAPAVSRHGTGVLAILAGSPDSGTPGLAPDAQYFAADVYRAGEGGQPVSDTMSLLRAMEWLGASRVSVINMSLSGPDDQLLNKAIADMSSRGIMFVAAAGNGGPTAPPSYPAAYPHVVAVTAIDRDLRGYIHANHGDYIDIAAPGVGIWTALPGALEGYQSGTSFAAPHATAILAAIQDRVEDRSKEGYLRALVIRDLGPAGRDQIYGRGLALAPAACQPATAVGDWNTSVVFAPAGYK